jgi:hypothetical protein
MDLRVMTARNRFTVSAVAVVATIAASILACCLWTRLGTDSDAGQPPYLRCTQQAATLCLLLYLRVDVEESFTPLNCYFRERPKDRAGRVSECEAPTVEAVLPLVYSVSYRVIPQVTGVAFQVRGGYLVAGERGHVDAMVEIPWHSEAEIDVDGFLAVKPRWESIAPNSDESSVR